MYSSKSIWYKANISNLSLVHKFTNLGLAIWSEVVLIGVAVLTLLGFPITQLQNSLDVVSSYLIYIFLMGVVSMMLVFVPSFSEYKKRKRINSFDTDDFPLVQVVGAIIFIPIFGYGVIASLGATFSQLVWLSLAVFQLLFVFTFYRANALTQMLIAITTLMVTMVTTVFAVLLIPLFPQSFLSIGLIVFVAPALITETYFWYKLSFSEPGTGANMFVRNVFGLLALMMLISVALFLYLGAAGFIT